MAPKRQYIDTDTGNLPKKLRISYDRHITVRAELPIHGLSGALEPIMDRQTLSIMKACEVVGVSRRTIYNWISAGKVEYVRTAGGSIRIFADTLWRDATATPVERPVETGVSVGPSA